MKFKRTLLFLLSTVVCLSGFSTFSVSAEMLSSKYNLTVEETFLKGLPEKTTSSDLLATLPSGSMIDSPTTFIGTGSKVAIEGTEYTLVVYGDVDGSGDVDSTDYLRIKGHFLGTYTLSDVGFLAGDVTCDKEIDSTDYLRIKSHFLGSYNLFENSIFSKEISFTVTFVDFDGTVLDEQNVVLWKNATAPTVPVREGYEFTGWDKSFDNITEDIVITAVYENISSAKHTVTFTDYNGTVLSTQEVAEGKSAVLPSNPNKTGATFLGWSGNYTNVLQDEIVRAVYSDERNVFIVASSYGNVGDTVSVLFSIDGQVNTCGFNLKLFYDESLELISYDNDLDLDIIVNDTTYTNGIKLNFSSASNKTKQRDIIELTFKIKDTSKKYLPIYAGITEVFEVFDSGVIEQASFVTINGNVEVK